MAANLTGKIDEIQVRNGTDRQTGQPSQYHIVKVGGKEYICNQKWIADKKVGDWLTVEAYQSKSGKDMIRLAKKEDGPVSGKQQRGSEDPDQTQKSICESYAVTLLAAHIAAGDKWDSMTENIYLLDKTLWLYDLVTMQKDRMQQVADAMLSGKQPPSGGSTSTPPAQVPMSTLEQRRNILDLCSALSLVPISYARNKIRKSVKSIDELTYDEAASMIVKLNADKAEADAGLGEDDVPF